MDLYKDIINCFIASKVMVPLFLFISGFYLISWDTSSIFEKLESFCSILEHYLSHNTNAIKISLANFFLLVMMMMISCFCRMLDRWKALTPYFQLELLQISETPPAGFEPAQKSEFRFCWMKLLDGFLYDCPGVVLSGTMMSACRDFYRAVVAVFTERKLVWCSSMMFIHWL